MTLIVDQSSYDMIRVGGSDRVRFLQGLTTVNVETLGPGDHAWGAILSPKGRLLSIFELGATDDDLWLLCEPSLGTATRALLEKYAVMDDVVFTDDGGPRHRLWETPAAAWQAPIVFTPPTKADVASAAEVEAWRIEAGIPRYGVDAGEDNFPFETPLAGKLDYKKGCYVGQEPVFRVYSQGQAQKKMCGLRFATTMEAAALPPLGSKVAHPTRPDAGKLTSATISARQGGAIALAMLHRTAWEPGTEVTVGDLVATVTELPFP